MEVKILDKKDNLFFNRTEITAEISHQGEPTPKRSDVRKALAEAMKVSADTVAVRQCKTQFGIKSVCKAAVYKTAEDMKNFEAEYVIGRETGHKTHHTKEAKAAEGAPAK